MKLTALVIGSILAVAIGLMLISLRHPDDPDLLPQSRRAGL